MGTLVWIAVVAGVLSGFFALTGFSLRSFSWVKLEKAFAGPSGRRRLDRLERHLRSLQLTASLGRSLSNLVLVVAVLYLFDPGHELVRAIGAMLIAGMIIAIVGVGIPSAWARLGGEKVLAVTLEVMLAFRALFYPFVAVIAAMDVPVRRLAGVAGKGDEDSDTVKQEVIQAASEGAAEGAVREEEAEMIASVMRLDEMEAREIMTPRTDVFALPVTLSCQEAARRVVEAGHSRVPVYEGGLDNIVGILYAKDLLGVAATAGQAPVRDVMRKAIFVPETKRLDGLLAELRAQKVHIAVVLDEYGGTAGLVTIEDVMEEIIGDIADEYDLAAPALLKRLDGRTAEADGRLRIDELNGAMGLRIPQGEDYDTVAGMIFAELGYIPPAGETLRVHAATFTVLAADERRITKVKVVLPKPAAGSEE
ncbi:MAG: hemolysin family protein [Phycisphaerae bacterium]|nr:hemolysin family protein [Phycisphaerae bacterium]